MKTTFPIPRTLPDTSVPEPAPILTVLPPVKVSPRYSGLLTPEWSAWILNIETNHLLRITDPTNATPLLSRYVFSRCVIRFDPAELAHLLGGSLPKEPMLTGEDAAKDIGVTERTIGNYIRVGQPRVGRLPAFRIGPRFWRIRRDDFAAFKEARRTSGTTPTTREKGIAV